MCIFHKWSKWEEYMEHFVTYPGKFAPQAMQGKSFEEYEYWVKRSCQKCGLIQRQPVKGDNQ